MTTKKSSAQKVKKQGSSAKSVKKVVTTPKTHHELWMKIGRWLIIVASIIVLLGVAVRIAFDVSPWPKALIIRHLFDEGGAKTKKALEKYVPATVASSPRMQYREGDKDAYLQAFYPQNIRHTQDTLPTIVWVHGGAWISGSTDNISNYLKIVASHGYTVIGIDYSLAPGSKYPKPIIQANDALRYIQDNADKLHADTSQIILAGDSAGAQIAAQLANLTTSPAYAAQMSITPTLSAEKLKGTVLNCGAYDLAIADYNGPSGDFLRTVLWSYSGTKDFVDDKELEPASVARFVTKDFPPTFITAGNIDPLEPQSKEMAKKLKQQGVSVDALFYPENHKPQLSHEYQFNLDIYDGKHALQQILAFLSSHTQKPQQ